MTINQLTNEMIALFLVFSNWALFALRLAVGVIFLARGLPKLKNLKAMLEVFGAVLLIFGFFTQIVALLLVFWMLIAVIQKKIGGRKFSDYETDILLVAANLVLATMGGGALAFLF